ncbi:MAG: FCD domain-containing protein [Nevskia sp.]|nr:FCD domain-containing protein [Nevskia sp.]
MTPAGPLSLEAGDAGGAPTTLIEAAYHELRRDIIAGVHAPGEKLRVEHLKDHYQVGAGTLREALARLVADSLVVAQGQRGFRVAALSLSDFEDITRTRILLETEALRQSIAHGDDAWEGQVVAAYHTLSLAEEKLGRKVQRAAADDWEDRNAAFHEALLAACPSQWIRHFLRILNRQSERYRRVSLVLHTIPRDVHAEHAAILDATLARDAKKAAALITRHISLTLDTVRDLPPDVFQKPKLKIVRRRPA